MEERLVMSGFGQETTIKVQNAQGPLQILQFLIDSTLSGPDLYSVRGDPVAAKFHLLLQEFASFNVQNEPAHKETLKNALEMVQMNKSHPGEFEEFERWADSHYVFGSSQDLIIRLGHIQDRENTAYVGKHF